MSTQRAQPPQPLDLSDKSPPNGPSTKRKEARRETEKLLLRFPPWVKPMVAEAAEAEGISMNVWATRVLAEAAKASRKGFVSQPIEMNTDRMAPSEPEPIAPFTEPTITVPLTPQPYTHPPYTGDPVTWPGTGTGTFTQTRTITNTPEDSAWKTVTDLGELDDEKWTPPDDDIPELT